MTTLGEIDGLERRLRNAVVALNKRKLAGVTIVEAIDEAELWVGRFEEEQPFCANFDVSTLLERAPFFICAVASEVGFRFEGVGTEYWNKFAAALGTPITMADRAKLGSTFAVLAKRYELSRPSESAFSEHFSIISWPIANALLPLDLVGAVSRLLSRAPSAALPGPGRNANFLSLRSWASVAEGARLVDWLRYEAASERVLTAILTENRGGGVSAASYARLHDAVAQSSEAFFATRAARQRARRTKAAAVPQGSLGRLTLTRDATGSRFYVSWPSLPSEIVEEARGIARAIGWRPQLWGAGARLHSDTALGNGPFALTHVQVPRADEPAYGDVAAAFGEGSAITAALGGRSFEWTETLFFDVNADRTRGEQRFAPFDTTSGTAWIARRTEISLSDGLRPIGSASGYRVFEADLGSDIDRAFLLKEGMLAPGDRTLIARHPSDAITAPQGVVRPNRPFVVYRPGPPTSLEKPESLRAGERSGYIEANEQLRVRCEAAIDAPQPPINLLLLERGTAFYAIIESRLQLRVESSYALRNVPITVELEINGKLFVHHTGTIEGTPTTIENSSRLLAPLYDDAVRSRLLESGSGTLRFSVGRLAEIEMPLARSTSAVDWSTSPPTLLQVDAETELVRAPATAPHRFTPTSEIVAPDQGAIGYALRFTDGRIADPMNLLAASNFNLGDFTATFSRDLGSRQLRDGGRGTGELARARIAWARAQCGTLQALAAKSRVVQQFEDPLIYNLCGREWYDCEHHYRNAQSDPHEVLYTVALEQRLASLPDGLARQHAAEFAAAFAVHARRLDADWPLSRQVPLDGAMDDALNLGFTDAVRDLQTRGAISDIDPDDCDFGNPEDAWAAAAVEALRRIRRSLLTRLIAPNEGGRQLRDRFYTDVSVAESAEDLAAWTRTFALPRGQLTSEAAAGALQLWLSPSACDTLDAALRVLVNDPFVARASRYVAIRMQTTSGGAR